jgi:hypothetical protein
MLIDNAYDSQTFYGASKMVLHSARINRKGEQLRTLIVLTFRAVIKRKVHVVTEIGLKNKTLKIGSILNCKSRLT